MDFHGRPNLHRASPPLHRLIRVISGPSRSTHTRLLRDLLCSVISFIQLSDAIRWIPLLKSLAQNLNIAAAISTADEQV